MRISEAKKNGDTNKNLEIINLSNALFRKIDSSMMKNLLESAGFNKESDLKFRINIDKLNKLESAIEFIDANEN